MPSEKKSTLASGCVVSILGNLKNKNNKAISVTFTWIYCSVPVTGGKWC
jgi:hypothetical protein